MNKTIIDIETDGLNPTKIWLAACKDINSDFVKVCFSREELLKTMENTDIFIGHGILGFDLPYLKKLWDIDIDYRKVEDTLVLSTLFYPERKGGHSLRQWGVKLKNEKGEHTDWSKLTSDMISYCIQDVRLTDQVYKHLLSCEKEDFSDRSIELEHMIKHIITQQERKGFYLNEKKTHMILSEIKSKSDEILLEVRQEIKPSVRLLREVTPRYKKDGCLAATGLQSIDRPHETVGGPFSMISFEPFNLGSPKQIIARMERFGWKPTEFTEKGQPKITQKNLETVSSTAPSSIRNLAKWKMLETRVKTMEGWLDALAPDDRVHGKVFPMGAVTGRMTHAEPNLANIVSSSKPYGSALRSCWTVENVDTHCLVGMDAKGLELRMLAHYMQDDNFISEVIDGDPHTYNQNAAGLETRAQAKTFIYALLYGAGAAKIGSIINGSSEQGKEIQEKFLHNVPKLGRLIEAVRRKASRGYIRGIDGRRLWIRQIRAALNTLLQGGGAIVCKQWSIYLFDEIQKRKLDAHLVNTIHDEQQYEVRKEHAEELMEIADTTMLDTGRFFGMRLPLNADATMGMTWAETH
jgi:DNA polymerase-1